MALKWKPVLLSPFLFFFASAASIIDASYAEPKATFSTVKIDYGTLRQGKVGEAVVQIGNAGDAPLEIQRVQSSCPCLTTDFPSDGTKPVVQPGAQFALTAKYDSTDVVGDRVATLVIATSDPAESMTAIDIVVNVEALVLTIPDKDVAWGMAPRGDEIGKELTFFSGTPIKDIELLEINMEKPTLSVTAAREETKDGFRIRARFRIAPEVPLGPIANAVTARLRVGNEEATLKIPVHGEAVGDVLVMPQSILCAPRNAYIQNQSLSAKGEGIIVRASRANQPLPEVLGVVAVGPIACIVHKNVKPDWGQTVDRHIIEVRTAQNAPPGPQSGTVHVMTTSKDQPIVSIPVFFRMAARVVADPEHVVLEPAANAPASQRVVLRDATGAALTIREVKFEQDLLEVQVEAEKTVDKDHPAAIVIRATAVPPAERKATMVSVVTDQPGAERILIPVLIRAPQTQ
ncbi:MAG: DUF1573 domain-containing protein [Candidatus Hydrogenedentales bacterium]|jgi:hypothetical protein